MLLGIALARHLQSTTTQHRRGSERDQLLGPPRLVFLLLSQARALPLVLLPPCHLRFEQPFSLLMSLCNAAEEAEGVDH